MNVLAIETSTAHASVALKIGEHCWIAEEKTLNKHAEWVLEAINDLLRQANVDLSSVEGIAFDEGPGSFTGIRIACAVAQGLAIGANLPLYPVNSLLAMVLGIASPLPHVLSVIDARMQQWYWGRFIEGELHGEIEVSAPTEITWPHVDSLGMVGFGFETLMQQFPVALQKKIQTYETRYPSASDLIQAVEQGKITAITALQAKPRYVRHQVAKVQERFYG